VPLPGLTGVDTAFLRHQDSAPKAAPPDPNRDVVIGQVIGERDSRNQWLGWHTLLQPDAPLPDGLRRIDKQSGVTQELSELRTMDAVLWLHGRDLGYKGSRGSNTSTIQ
jgi:hypothetical protein